MWPSLRAPLLAVVLTTAIALPALAHASPPDSTWIAGVYDDADSDDVIVRVTSAAGDVASGPPADLRPLHALVLGLVPCAESATASLADLTAQPRAPPTR
ncbi:MAG TPA: hypothetical protein VKN16_03115 [Methylomirabilota bacterium]|nr:hypothetical protein [Methylomirabilota bacterium]